MPEIELTYVKVDTNSKETQPLKSIRLADAAKASSSNSDEGSIHAENFNCAFFKRAFRILKTGLGNPITNIGTWMFLLVNLTTQVASAYLLQSMLYILATGRSSTYPGFSAFAA